MTLCILLYENSDYIKSWVCSGERASLLWLYVISLMNGDIIDVSENFLQNQPLETYIIKTFHWKAILTHFITISLMILEELHLIFPLNLIFQNQLILSSNFSSSGPLILFLIRLFKSIDFLKKLLFKNFREKFPIEKLNRI